MDKFGLSHDEVVLAKQFFNRDPIRAVIGPIVRPRLAFNEINKLTVLDLCEYEYPNQRRGTYPLDTNTLGMLSSNEGHYHSDSEESHNESEEVDPEVELEIMQRQLSNNDELFKRRF